MEWNISLLITASCCSKSAPAGSTQMAPEEALQQSVLPSKWVLFRTSNTIFNIWYILVQYCVSKIAFVAQQYFDMAVWARYKKDEHLNGKTLSTAFKNSSHEYLQNQQPSSIYVQCISTILFLKIGFFYINNTLWEIIKK